MNFGDEPSFADMARAEKFAAAKHAALEEKTACATRELLSLAFPRCFAGKGEDKTPVKIGIAADIRKRLPDLSRKQIRRALGDYCSGPSYHRGMLSAHHRVDLDGSEAGDISDNARQFARNCLERIKTKRATKREAA